MKTAFLRHKPNPKELFEMFKSTHGLKGNIYQKVLTNEIIALIKDFLDLRKDYRNPKKEYDIDENANFMVKAKMEMSITTKKFPGIINSSDSKENDELIEQVENLYRKHLNIECSQFDRSVFIKSIFTINVADQAHFSNSWIAEQESIRRKVTLVDSRSFSDIKFLAGCDISFDKNDKTRAVASFVIFDYPDLKQVAEISVKCSTNIPYQAGFLTFREVPILMHLLGKTKEHFPELVPEFILMDGYGIFHPRRCGIASHFAILSGIPRVGVSKSVLYVDNLTREEMLTQQIGSSEGDMVDIHVSNGEVICSAFNATGHPKNSTYISVGSGISLTTAKILIKQINDKFKNKIVEPIRAADLLSRIKKARCDAMG